ncbi:MAG: hypothetical protein II825_01270 [Paludibacteraceae bacterium]|nr:hypothetical protein [Paludibacteraceae bacterium]
MARERLASAVNELHGATSPGHIHRVKRFRDAKGRIIGIGVQETYDVQHPRDYKRKPAKGAEKANQNIFKKASLIMEKALNDPKQNEYWQRRFEAQLYATRGSKPDPYATYDPKRGTKKRYVRFDAFVRTMIMQEMKDAAKKR